jgi:RimJ/RimL family protein N-acetyltransferase
MLSQKISFLLGPGGFLASLFFGLKVLSRVEVFRVACKPLTVDAAAALPADWRYLFLRSPTEFSQIPTAVASMIAAQSGCAPDQLFARSGSIHTLVCGEFVVAQLNIETGPTCEVDDPRFVLQMAAGDALVGHLYTWPDFRRQKAAQILIATTESQLAKQGLLRLVTHVRSTNVPSLAVFKYLGWRFHAFVFSNTNGDLLSSLGMRKLGLNALPVLRTR